MGAFASEPGSREPDPQAVPALPGFDPSRVRTIGNAILILGDASEIVRHLQFDRAVMDPPYGVAGGWGSGLRQSSARGAKSDYQAAFEDTRDYVATTVVPIVTAVAERAKSVAVTTGIKNSDLYPKPAHIGSLQYPGSTVMSCWGPVLWQPIYFYGRDPHQGKLRPDSRPNCNDVDRDTPHPCPKPLKQWTWLVERASLPGEVVLDAFMGSGTTGVACAQLGRTFIGIELDPTHFETACKRIEDAQRQGSLFGEAA